MDFQSRSPSDNSSRPAFLNYPSQQYSQSGNNSPQPIQPRRISLGNADQLPRVTEENEEWGAVFRDLQQLRLQSMELQSSSTYQHLLPIVAGMQKQLSELTKEAGLGSLASAALKERNFAPDIADHPQRALQWVQGSWMYEDVDPNIVPQNTLEHALLTQPAVQPGPIMASTAIRIPQLCDCNQQGKNPSVMIEKVVLTGASCYIDSVDTRKDILEERVSIENQANMDYTIYSQSPVLMQSVCTLCYPSYYSIASVIDICNSNQFPMSCSKQRSLAQLGQCHRVGLALRLAQLNDQTLLNTGSTDQASTLVQTVNLAHLLRIAGTELLEKSMGVDNDYRCLLQPAMEDDSYEEETQEPLLNPYSLNQSYSNSSANVNLQPQTVYANSNVGYNNSSSYYNTNNNNNNNNNFNGSSHNSNVTYNPPQYYHASAAPIPQVNTFTPIAPLSHAPASSYNQMYSEPAMTEEGQQEHMDMKVLARLAAEKAMKVTEERKKKGSSTAGTRSLPAGALEILRGWLFANFDNPYPEEAEKESLAQQTGLTKSQVNYWMINARVRIWKPMLKQQQQKIQKNKKKVKKE